MDDSLASITPVIYRRFVLGAQGLWPARRWAGKDGRPNKTPIVNGIWLEEGLQADAVYQAAFERGLARFAEFLGADQVEKIN
jgi:hypothetical protein